MTDEEPQDDQTESVEETPRPAAGPKPTILHPNQTTSQPVVFRCPNRECFESPLDNYFDFESDDPTCPKCGMGPPYVQKRALIHMLLRDPKGPILGEGGLRFKIACTPQRYVLATLTNGEAATGDSSAVNCPGCLKVLGDKIIQAGTSMGLRR